MSFVTSRLFTPIYTRRHFRRDSKGIMQLNPAFPAVDPIPLPAPIWLLKLLHIVTLALHFVAVEMLLGGLLLAVLFSLFRRSQPGRWREGSRWS